MCYLVAKKFGSVGCSALQTNHGQHLVELKKKIIDKVGTDNIQLVTISRPSAYGENYLSYISTSLSRCS